MKRPNLGKRTRGQRLGIRGYLFALRELQKGDRTADDIAASMGMTEGGDHATLLMRRLRSVSLAHVCGWRRRADGADVAIYRYGAGESVPAPLGHLIKAATARASINATAIYAKHLMRAVQGLASKREIAEMVGTFPQSVGTIVNYMHEIGLVHIGAWTNPRRGMPVALYIVGGTRDAERPKPGTEEPRRRRERKAAVVGRAQMIQMIRATAANDPQVLEAA